ncbi:hypothetical protein HK100_002554 [Physocladia obscura]|uniref:Uncharacterized protein n=1 Tax=Physocladia obscura TaxID=109957 RepID=A0AAD5SW70_9FUNG|nr:hypothetical protein HK100_002554 [Physocladia obscura]
MWRQRFSIRQILRNFHWFARADSLLSRPAQLVSHGLRQDMVQPAQFHNSSPICIASLNIRIPCLFILPLVCELRASQRREIELQNHTKYQLDVKHQLEWRAMELETQRMSSIQPKRDIHDLDMACIDDPILLAVRAAVVSDLEDDDDDDDRKHQEQTAAALS